MTSVDLTFTSNHEFRASNRFARWWIRIKFLNTPLKSTIAVRVTTRNARCRRLMLVESRRPDALKYRRNELPADLAASGRDRPLCPRQFDSASDQLLTTRSTCFKHDAHKFSASHLNQKPCYMPHNFVPIYLPTSVHDLSRISIDCLTQDSRLRCSASV